MAAIVSVVSFDDNEREVLGGGSADRTAFAKSIGDQIKRLVNETFKEARELASINPTGPALQSAITKIDSLDTVLAALPTSEDVAATRSEAARVREVVNNALGALPA